MKSILVRSFIVCFVILVCFAPNHLYAYDLGIDTFEIDIIVNEDNSLDITEVIDVKFNQSSMHGIFRDLPIKTYFGKPVKISNIRVENFPYTQEKIDGQLRLKIGNENSYARETEQYIIHYKYSIGDDRNLNLDEVYFNLVGTSWEIPIQRTTFKITMPKNFDKSNINFTYGIDGSTDSKEVKYQVNGNVVTGSLDQMLYPKEGLTVALTLPEGYFSKVVSEKFLLDYMIPLLPVIIIGLFLASVFLWFRFGKLDKLIPTVEFYPPKYLTPMEIGYIFDQQVDTYDLTAMLIFWADTGYIRFNEVELNTGKFFKRTEKTIQIEKLYDLPTDLSDFELTYFNDLFNLYGHNNMVQTSSLENCFYVTLSKVTNKLIDMYKRDPNKKIITDGSKRTAKGLNMIGFIMLFFVYEVTFHENNPYQIMLSTVFSVAFSCIIGLLTLNGGKKLSLISSRMLREKISYTLKGSLWILVSVAMNFALIFYTSSTKNLFIYGILVQSIFLLASISKKRTAYGNQVISYLVGFKSFIEKAEKDRIQQLVSADPEYFYHILPFAMALGVTDTWAKQFETIAMEPPRWYYSPYMYGPFSATTFTSYLNQNTKSIGYSMSSSPSSSGGSSDGGSSGGGSGGGGGGGW